MATYAVTDPEGKTWHVEGNGSQAEALAHFQSQWKPAGPPMFPPGGTADRFAQGAKSAVVDPWERLGKSYMGEDVYAPGETGWEAWSKRLGGAAMDMAGGPLALATLGSGGGLMALLKGGATIAGIGGGLNALHAPEGIKKANDYLEGQVAQGNLNPGLGALLGTGAEVLPGMVPEAVAGLGGRLFKAPPAAIPEAPPVAPPVEPVQPPQSPLGELLGTDGRPFRPAPAPEAPGTQWSAPKPKQPFKPAPEPVYGQPSKPLGLPDPIDREMNKLRPREKAAGVDRGSNWNEAAGRPYTQDELDFLNDGKAPRAKRGPAPVQVELPGSEVDLSLAGDGAYAKALEEMQRTAPEAFKRQMKALQDEQLKKP